MLKTNNIITVSIDYLNGIKYNQTTKYMGVLKVERKK